MADWFSCMSYICQVLQHRLVLLGLLFVLGCNEKPRSNEIFSSGIQIDTSKILDSSLAFSGKPIVDNRSELEIQIASLGLVNIHDLDTSIVVDLKYSSTNNFMGMDVYGNFDQCFLQPDVAKKLCAAEKFLKEKYPFYSLIVFDAVRPLHIQQKMWDTIQLPPAEKIKYLSNPKNFSLHNYGAAVDVSIIDQNGMELNMGTPFDFFGVKAHPVKEQELLTAGELTQRELLNRQILRNVMWKAGFFGIQTEWWHFNSCTREVAAGKYQIVK